MNHYNSREWKDYLNNSLDKILSMEKKPFLNISKSLPKDKGIYIISEMEDNVEVILYIGRTKNLKNRIYTNHLMGPTTNARLKNYIVKDSSHSCYKNADLAKIYIKENCYVRWILEEDYRKRGVLEGYFTAMLFPKYGIYEEH